MIARTTGCELPFSCTCRHCLALSRFSSKTMEASQLDLAAQLTNLGISAPLSAVYNAIADAVAGIADKIPTASVKPGMHV